MALDIQGLQELSRRGEAAQHSVISTSQERFIEWADRADASARFSVLSATAKIQSTVGAQAKRQLAKIEEGTYGICDGCGQPIDPERLAALVHAVHCIECARSARGGPLRRQ